MEKYRAILKQYWGYPDFRGIQADIIRSISAGHDTLGLMPTGGGKSITFQVPTLAMEGMCLVVTPLIALMKDQVYNLRRRGIPAAAVYSGQSREEIVRHLDNAVFGAYKFLYVSPERLATPLFLNKVTRMKVCLLTIDEAHCISQWGYDFRPHYLRIAEVREKLPGVPALALTATATALVIDDIRRHLHFRDDRLFRMSFARKNLRYVVRYAEEKLQEALHILRSVPGCAILYTRNRKQTEDVAERLREEGIAALNFHAGLTPLEKEHRQLAWQTDRVRVMVATNAFGMGIDKPDVRLVVHLDVPDSVEAYFQEAGRAGRDGLTSYAVLLHDDYDAVRLDRHLAQAFPDRDYVRRVYTELAYFFQVAEGEAEGRTFDFDIDRFCRVFRHYPANLIGALNLLTQAGYIHFSLEDGRSARAMFLVDREQLYYVRDLTPEQDRVINAMLRSDGGFFVDYVPIEEDRLAERSELPEEQVHEVLKQLSRRRIIHFIPHKEKPQLTYVMRRVDTCYVEIPRSVYEQRRELLSRRIRAMAGYFGQDDLCRSRYLLQYFGDDAPDCGHCDVCLARKRGADAATRREQDCENFLRGLLDSPGGCRADDLDRAPFPREHLYKYLNEWLRKATVVCDGGVYRWAKPAG